MDWVENLRTVSDFSGDLLFDEPLSKHTYFKIGGPASAVAIPKNESDLRILRKLIATHHVPHRIIGLGSNLLAPDEGVRALLIKTTKLNLEIERIETDPAATAGRIRIGAGVTVASLLRRAAIEGWSGFESISGIPGTMGGVIYMNGGTHMGEAKEHLAGVRAYSLDPNDNEWLDFDETKLAFAYRKNLFLKPHHIAYEAIWKIRLEEPSVIRERLDSLYRRRKETQPLDYPSCGSVFKNPRESGLAAWQVVDRLGLRGHRIGNAQIAEKHPNWILNLGGAKAKDVLALINLVKARAKAELGIEMHEEVRLLA